MLVSRRSQSKGSLQGVYMAFFYQQKLSDHYQVIVLPDLDAMDDVHLEGLWQELQFAY